MLLVEDVSAAYGSIGVLHGIGIALAPGRPAALLGPNGAGKTTLLRVLAGQLKPSLGRVCLDGKDINGLRPNRRARAGVCLIPEGRGIFPSLTVEENLKVFDHRQERQALAFDRFPPLFERRHQRSGTLSGGEQQMLALARVYVQRPAVVLVDEASTGLAPFLVDSIYEHFAQMAADGITLLIVEQYARKVLEIVEDVFLLSRGRIVFAGPANTLTFDDLATRYFAE